MLSKNLALNRSLMVVHAGEEPTSVRVEPAVVLFFNFPLPYPSAGAEDPRDGGFLAACRSLEHASLAPDDNHVAGCQDWRFGCGPAACSPSAGGFYTSSVARKGKEQRRGRCPSERLSITSRGLLVDGFRLCCIYMSTWVDIVLCIRRQQLTASIGVSTTGLLGGVEHLLPGCWVFVVKVSRFPYLNGTDAPLPLVLVEFRKIDRSTEVKARATMPAALKEQRPTSRKQDR